MEGLELRDLISASCILGAFVFGTVAIVLWLYERDDREPLRREGLAMRKSDWLVWIRDNDQLALCGPAADRAWHILADRQTLAAAVEKMLIWERGQREGRWEVVILQHRMGPPRDTESSLPAFVEPEILDEVCRQLFIR